MELLYKNEYGLSYRVKQHKNINCVAQIVIDSIGLFMSKKDMANLINIIDKFDEPCNCKECNGKKCNKIWTNSFYVDVCIRVDSDILPLLKDLITGTLFMLNIDATLEQNEIKI